ncbi:formyltransferase family protein [Leptospira mayottensis]|uniref:formyltransferase family protein n=1 Tax=Leptospira mayottensis TaxID=1137606 RepID=UPI000E35A6B9|nr:formyltransferase family protein [Leptospira mayottensis]AXR69288.1 methionyl-tRNA formyltransferase [Leptospira mayottensis]
MNITILTDRESWINNRLDDFKDRLRINNYNFQNIHNLNDLKKGNICFILSFSKILKKEQLEFHQHNIVVHESDLPKGKGWSPLTWQILEGKSEIPICLFEADAKGVDSGIIYYKDFIHLEGHELVEEIRDLQAQKTFELCLKFLNEFPAILKKAKQQVGIESFFPKRTPVNSKVEITKTLEELFLNFRVADNERYPVFFEKNGINYLLKIYKMNK